MKNKLVIYLVILAVGLTGCGPSTSAGTSPSEAGIPHAWFDSPLPGSIIFPPNPCQVLAHGASPNGIVLFELTINGEAASIPSPDPSASLVTLTRDCNLTQPGEYLLLLRVQDTKGTWSGYAETNLSIALEESPSATATTTRIEPTATPTPGVTRLFSAPTLSMTHFYYGGSACGRTEVTFGIDLLNPAARHVYLFYRVENKDSGETGSWSEGAPMFPGGGNHFQLVLRGNDIPGLIIPSGSLVVPINYTVYYQFVATDASENIVGRSDVYMDLLLSYCSG
jgi:hypothetical protein